MSYKILYIEDLPTGSIQNDLERCGFEVAVNNADDFNDTLSDIVDNVFRSPKQPKTSRSMSS